MSRGLGRVEQAILRGLHAMRRPWVALWELVLLVDGQIASLDQDVRHWGVPICQPHPPQRKSIPGIGVFTVEHERSCYPPEPTRSLQEAVGRAVRSLARKGLVQRAYKGTRPKCLVVYLPTADPSHLPKQRRFRQAVEYAVRFGVCMRYRRTWV